MTDQPTTQEMLDDILSGTDIPISALDIVDSFEEYQKPFRLNNLNVDLAALRSFLSDMVRDFTIALNIKFLTSTCRKVESVAVALPPIKFRDFQLTRDPSFEQINSIMKAIQESLSELQQYKEEVAHYISVLRAGINYIDSLKKAITQFLSDDFVVIAEFSNKSTKSKFLDTFISHLDSHKKVIQSNSTALNSIMDNVLGPRQNMLLRADSAIRLLTKAAELEFGIGGFGSENRPTTKDSDFEVEKV